ncbi:VHS domain-containing protein [Nymphaea thermarum]|nr:VHS domain-containing protein [Nymphaea thermarum]
MDSSRRAVEAYWRSRMIDAVTSDEDKVAPVYKLEEICELLRTSHVSIVKEVSDYILKRLDHKNPIVKQKALRLIKYAVGKSGVEFRREMQRHSAAVRQLFHYRGQVDALKGDALNKAVRDTAHEAVSEIFASEEKPAPAEHSSRRIQGFGNTNFEPQTEEKKSFLSEVVGMGGASIIQGLTTLASGNSLMKSDSGSYRSPNLRRSLTVEKDRFDKYETEEHHKETWGSSSGRNNSTRSWSVESREALTDASSSDTSPGQKMAKGPEERLLDTIVTAGGVRLQPTRDAIQVFLKEAAKLDPVSMSLALESRLQSHVWQIRVKAACLLEAILRKKDEEHFSAIASFFSENKDAVIKCSESPQASVREKANKVLALLDGNISAGGEATKTISSDKVSAAAAVQLPNLIDTGDLASNGTEGTPQSQDEGLTMPVPSSHAVDDLLGDGFVMGFSRNSTKSDEADPFADVSFHTKEADSGGNAGDLFSGLVVDDKDSSSEANESLKKNQLGSFDAFADSFEEPRVDSLANKNGLDVLMAGLSMNDGVKENQVGDILGGGFAESMSPVSNNQQARADPNDILKGLLNSQASGAHQNGLPPSSSVQYNFPSNIMFNQALASQQVNYSAMGNLIAQQQLLAAMSNFQNLGHVGYNAHVGKDGGYSSALPDVFQMHGYATQNHSVVMESSKKEETRAFDFISDHISAARDPKRVI